MEKLVRVAANVFYTRLPKAKKKDPERFAKHYNFILSVEGTQTILDEENKYVQDRKLSEISFVIADSNFDEMIAHFQNIRNMDETDIKKTNLKAPKSK